MYLKLKFIRTRSVVAQLLAVLLSFKLFYFRFCCISRDVSICIGTVSPLVSLEGTLCQIAFSTSGSLQRMLLFKYPSQRYIAIVSAFLMRAMKVGRLNKMDDTENKKKERKNKHINKSEYTHATL